MSAQSHGRFAQLLAHAGALAAALVLVAPAQAEQAPPPPKPVCAVSSSGLDSVLERTRERLTHRKSLTVVAIGSSSTSGFGATSPAASYPSRLEVFLKARFPGIAIRVLNRGVGGEEEANMLARFDKDVIAEKPDLVLWQVGSNAVMRERPVAMEEQLIHTGIERLKRIGADIVLVDPQYTTAVLEKSALVPIVELISAQAREQGTGVFKRFDLMKDWHETRHLPFDAFSVADGLHMNDWGYDCFARNLAAAIIDASASAAMASAKTGSTH